MNPQFKQPAANPETPKVCTSRRRLLGQWPAAAALALMGMSVGVRAQPERKAAAAELLRLWRQSGGALLIRHAATESGLGDPAGFTLGQCRTQRNLSDAGKQASQVFGAWLQAQNFKPDAVLSSQWCRCQDTARLAFGQFEDWPALNSTFAGQGDPAAQQKALLARLRVLPQGRTEVWVTHQVNMTGLTGAYPSMGEGFLVDRQGRLLARAELAP
ncbi:histidine phosphatase family protein [Limnohabitans sp. 2KL-51]|uniref:histidine phosphatase family protein n=1 Tax=Limnohabitans sp. 2KL-51 TaxID=1977911 RepID=UPI000D338C47|nr:histidine phosphatase family protein [Limnohabitans sp. 2KL-51]PUE44993.1 histidine phosphatase family protein [Limnohabitans sp. 2KL-51]